MKLKHLLILALCACIFAPFEAFAEGQKRETRNVWLATVVNIDWPQTKGTSSSVITKQKQQLLSYITNFHNINMNAISLQVRSMCDAMYKSSYEPWSSYLTGTRGTDPGWDPLAYAVEQCHALGMECHAWVNPYRWSTGSDWSTPQDLALKNSGMLITYGTKTVLNPGLEASRQRIVNVCKELITNYDIDGIIFDDYFYPDGIPETSAAPDYDLWKSSGSPLSLGDWRRANVNLMVKEVFDMVQATKPFVKVAIGPAGVAGTAATSASKHNVDPCPTGSDWQYSTIYSDPLAWLEEGTIDYIAPQLYWKRDHATNAFGPLTQWWSYVANHFGRHHYASQNVYFLTSTNTQSDWEEVAAQIDLSRQYNKDNAPGVVFYSAKYICGPTNTGLGDYLKTNLFTTPALTPAFSWKQHDNYDAPKNLALNSGKLSWTGIDKSLMKYSIYAIPLSVLPDAALSSKFEGIKSDYLLGLSYTPSFTIPTEYLSGYWYAVCIVDGYGNEFAPAFVKAPGKAADKVTLTAPINDATALWRHSFSWSAAANGSFRLQISRLADFSYIDIDKKDITTNSCLVDLNSLSSETKYYWRITTSQPSCWDTTSDAASFLTPSREKAPVVTLVSPANGTELQNNFDFVCSKVTTDIYTLQVSKSSDFANISFSTSDFVADGSNMKYPMNIAKLSNGTYFWRVITSKLDCDDSYSAVNTFTVSGHPVGTFEDGYFSQTDKASYSTVAANKISSDWIRSINADYNNFPNENDGLFNRGMIATTDFVYLSGRNENTATSAIYLLKYDANTGELVGKVKINDDGRAPYYPCNDIIKDSKGNILISNLTLNIGTTPLKLFSVNIETGEVHLVAACTSNNTIRTRIDHCAVYGDVVSGNFNVFAATASGTQIVRWTFVNGTQTDEKVITAKSFYPTSATDFGIAPRIFPVSADKVYVNGGSTYFTLYNLSDGSIADSFAANPALVPNGKTANGGCIFSHAGKNFMLYPYEDFNASNGFCFMLASANADYAFSSLSRLWLLPEKGLGKVNSQTWGAATDVVKVSDDITRIYMYVPGNGIAAYTLSKATSGIDDIDADEVSVSVVGNSVTFSAQVDKAEIFDSLGRKIAEGSNTSVINGIDYSGVILIKYEVNCQTFAKKAVIK